VGRGGLEAFLEHGNETLSVGHSTPYAHAHVTCDMYMLCMCADATDIIMCRADAKRDPRAFGGGRGSRPSELGRGVDEDSTLLYRRLRTGRISSGALPVPAAAHIRAAFIYGCGVG
jgi:hypothetical protein